MKINCRVYLVNGTVDSWHDVYVLRWPDDPGVLHICAGDLVENRHSICTYAPGSWIKVVYDEAKEYATT